MAILEWFLQDKQYLKIPETIPSKESLCVLLDYIDYPVNSSTDILRYIAYYSPGCNIKFPGKLGHLRMSGSLRKRSIKILKDLVSRVKIEYLLQEMNRYRASWLAFTKAAHPNIPELFDAFFGKDKSWKKSGWGYRIRKSYDENNWDDLIRLYSQRPGEFIRHFDSLFRRFINVKGNYLQELLSNLVELRISTKMLINLSYYYDIRESIKDNRSFINKQGERITYDKDLPEISRNYIEVIQDSIRKSIYLNYKNQESLEEKKVFLSLNPEIELNLSERTSQEGGIEAGIQGVKVEIPKTGLLRFFVQWIDPTGENDLDIHAQGIFSESGKMITIGWFDSFKDSDKIISHSGDIRCQKGDCAEYITVDVEKAIKSGFDKLVISADDYNGYKLGKSCDTFIGYSIVKKLHPENNWSPLRSNTPFRVQLGPTNNRFMCLYVVNLMEGWMKVVTESMPFSDYRSKINFEHYFNKKTLNLGKLIEINVKSRNGQIVDSPDEETIVIDSSNYQEWVNLLLE